MTPNSGATLSAIGMPTRMGGSSGPPLVIMSPLSAWMTASIAGTPASDSFPNPLIEQ